MKNINFFVYGSLREGFYNYNKFYKENNFELIEFINTKDVFTVE